MNDDRSNALLVPTWFTGTSTDHAYLASPDLLDPEKYFIVIVDALANGVSISPSNSKTQPGGQFPQITITDMVESQHRLLTEILDIQSLHGVVGLSMGGMQAFEWAVRYPGFANRAVATLGARQVLLPMRSVPSSMRIERLAPRQAGAFLRTRSPFKSPGARRPLCAMSNSSPP